MHILTLTIALFPPLVSSHRIHYRPYPRIPYIGDIFGHPPFLNLNYYYPLIAPHRVRTTFSTGLWPGNFPIRPSSIYECQPDSDQAFAPRCYTCHNPSIPQEMKTPEGIHGWEVQWINSYESGTDCDANTGLATEALHWGAWQHNCWSKSASVTEHYEAGHIRDGPNRTTEVWPWAVTHVAWNADALYWRRVTLLQLSSHCLTLNRNIRGLWEEKSKDLQGMSGSGYKTDELWVKMGQREARFWVDSWPIREQMRELEKLVPIYFMARVKREKIDFKWNGMGNVPV